MSKTVQGKAYGRTIELSEDLDIAEGQAVAVHVRIVNPATSERHFAGLLRSEGVLADDPYFDDIIAEVYRTRNVERPSTEPK
jgi:hypothetical protein